MKKPGPVFNEDRCAPAPAIEPGSARVAGNVAIHNRQTFDNCVVAFPIGQAETGVNRVWSTLDINNRLGRTSERREHDAFAEEPDVAIAIANISPRCHNNRVAIG